MEVGPNHAGRMRGLLRSKRKVSPVVPLSDLIRHRLGVWVGVRVRVRVKVRVRVGVGQVPLSDQNRLAP